jgi:amino acid transporter
MADSPTPTAPKVVPTLGLTGLTINAMALIAPGAFLWLTYQEQCLYGAPTAGAAMWFGFLVSLLLCFATAISYAELSKLYPGAGSSYLYAEQAFLSKHKAFKYARVIKFFTGWVSHLYYWVYPGLMVGVTAIFVGYISGILMPNTFSSVYDSPLEMILFSIVFSIGVSWIAYRGAAFGAGVNIACNVIQITALVIFACIAIGYRLQHKEGSTGWHLSNGEAVQFNVDQVPVTAADDKGVQQPVPGTWSDGTTQYTTSANITADDLDATKNKDADALAGYKALSLVVGDPKPDFQKDASGKYVMDKDGKVQPVVSMKTQDRQITDDDMDKTKNASGEGADRLATLTALGLGSGDPYPVFQKDKDGKLLKDSSGHLIPDPFIVSYTTEGGGISGADGSPKQPLTFNYHANAASVLLPHNASWLVVQACIAILCLVGFESVSAMGEEALNPMKDIPRAIILSLVIQGAICYLFEYFATNYVLNSGYGMTNAAASGAPIGDLMVLTGSWLFGSYSAGKAFMLTEAFTVFLALIGTTLACLSTGARVTYAMGRDEEVGSSFGQLHAKNLTPHKSIWTLCWISIVIGIITVTAYLGAQSQDMAVLDKHNIWYSFGIFSPHTYTWLPNTLLIVTLTSNFGTFVLYMTTCIIAIVAFREHHSFHGFKHLVVPIFGLLANFACMLFYLVGPFVVAGMSWHEPFIALGVAAVWGIYGVVYFRAKSKATGKEMFLSQKPATST